MGRPPCRAGVGPRHSELGGVLPRGSDILIIALTGVKLKHEIREIRVRRAKTALRYDP